MIILIKLELEKNLLIKNERLNIMSIFDNFFFIVKERFSFFF